MGNEVFLGSVYGYLELKTEKWDSAITSASDQLDQLETKTKNQMASIGKSLETTGKKLFVGLTLPLAAFGSIAIKTGSTYEETMRTIQSISGASEAVMSELTAEIEKFGKLGSFNTQQVADSMVDMIRDGLTPAQIKGGQLAAVYSLAAGQGVQMADAQITISDTLQAFGKDVDSATRFADVFTNVLINSPAVLNDLAEAMQYVAPQAANTGQSIETTAAMIGALAQAGLRGSVAGAGLQMMMMQLGNPTDKANKSLQAMGISIYDNDGKMRNMMDIIGEMTVATSKMTDKEKNNTLGMIFTSRALKTVLTLTGEASGAFDKMRDVVGETGTTLEIAERKQKGMNHELKIAKNTFIDYKKSVSDVLYPMLKPFITMMTDLMKSFNESSPAVQKLKVSFGLFLAAIGPILWGLGTMAKLLAKGGALNTGWKIISSGISFVAKAIWGFLPAIGSFIAAFWPFILVAGLIAGAAYLIWKNWNVIKPVLENFWKGIKENWGIFIEWVTTAWNNVVTFFKETLPTKIKEGWTNILTFFSELPAKMLQFGIDIITGLWNGIVNYVGNLITTIAFIVGLFIYGLPAIWNWLVENVPIWWENFITWMIDFGEKVKSKLKELWQSFVKWGTDTWNYLKVEIPRIFAAIIVWFSEMPGKIWEWLVKMYEKFVEWGVNTWNYLKVEVPNWIANVIAWLAELPGKAYEKMNKLKDKVVEATTNAIDDMKKTIDGWLETAKNWGENIAKAFVSGFSKLGEWLKEKVKAGLDAAKALIQGKSPPKKGPFKHIDVWGANVGQAWVDGVQQAISSFSLPNMNIGSLMTPSFAGIGSNELSTPQVTKSNEIGSNNYETNNKTSFTVNIGMYAGSEMEKREIAKQLNDSLLDYQKGAGETI